MLGCLWWPCPFQLPVRYTLRGVPVTKGHTPLSDLAHSLYVPSSLWSPWCWCVDGLWGTPHHKVNNSPWSHSWCSLMSGTSWPWAAQWAIWQASVRTEHISQLPMSDTIGWQGPFALQEQRNKVEPLLMWVDAFIAQTQMSQRRKGSALGWRAPSSSLRLLHTRELLVWKKVHSPCRYINCGSLLIDSKKPHVLSLSLEGHFCRDMCEKRLVMVTNQHMD